MDNARPMAVILDALDRTHRRACGQTGIHYMSIPVNPERDADVILSDAIDELGRMRDAEAPLLARIAELEQIRQDAITGLGRIDRALGAGGAK